MTHLDDDILLKFLLGTLEGPDDSRVREHVAGCQRCREREEKLQAEIGRLSGIEMRVEEAAAPPLPRQPRLLAVVSRAAAILAVGFLAGYMTAELSNPDRPIAVQQRLVPTHPTVPSTGYYSCQTVDISAGR
jgi:anti-sigma factor RsiW